jgi:hypothetical protein
MHRRGTAFVAADKLCSEFARLFQANVIPEFPRGLL